MITYPINAKTFKLADLKGMQIQFVGGLTHQKTKDLGYKIVKGEKISSKAQVVVIDDDNADKLKDLKKSYPDKVFLSEREWLQVTLIINKKLEQQGEHLRKVLIDSIKDLKVDDVKGLTIQHMDGAPLELPKKYKMKIIKDEVKRSPDADIVVSSTIDFGDRIYPHQVDLEDNQWARVLYKLKLLTESKSEKKVRKTEINIGPLTGKVILFADFKDEALKTKVVTAGGLVRTSFTPNVNLIVANDTHNDKKIIFKKANESKIEIISKEALVVKLSNETPVSDIVGIAIKDIKENNIKAAHAIATNMIARKFNVREVSNKFFFLPTEKLFLFIVRAAATSYASASKEEKPSLLKYNNFYLQPATLTRKQNNSFGMILHDDMQIVADFQGKELPDNYLREFMCQQFHKREKHEIAEIVV